MNKVEKIKAEIERLKNELIQEAEKGYKSEFDEGRISAFEDMITFIDTLEVKEINSTDAFINKACAYLDSIGHRYIIDAFRKYMEKE